MLYSSAGFVKGLFFLSCYFLFSLRGSFFFPLPFPWCWLDPRTDVRSNKYVHKVPVSLCTYTCSTCVYQQLVSPSTRVDVPTIPSIIHSYTCILHLLLLATTTCCYYYYYCFYYCCCYCCVGICFAIEPFVFAFTLCAYKRTRSARASFCCSGYCSGYCSRSSSRSRGSRRTYRHVA